MLNKQIIKDAIADAREIEKFAIEQAKKSLEEALMPQIEKAIQESLDQREISNEVESAESFSVNESTVGAENEIISENQIPKNIQEMEINKNENQLEEELFEVEGLFEDEAPEAETAQEPAESSVEAKLDDLSAKLDQLLAAAKGEEGEEASAEGEVEVVDDEAGEAEAPAPAAPAPAPAAAQAPQEPAAPAQTVTEDLEEESLEEVMFEIEEDTMNEDLEEEGIQYEVSLEEDLEEEALHETDMEEEAIFEIDMEEEESEQESGLPKPPKEYGGIKGGMVGEDMEEEAIYEIDMEEGDLNEKNYGGSFASINRAGNRERKERLPMHAPMNESKKIIKIKAQYESKLDGLIKENESLKGVIKNYKSNLKEFESSFVELKSQLNEMQVFNGKLAYANKLLTKGGLTNDEKIRIAEEFDKCPTVEDAKKLYNKIISENKFSGKEKIAEKLKSAKPSTAPIQNLSESKSETLFESEERRRMKMLAGLVKPINE